MECFSTVLHEGIEEIVINKSRFIGHVKPVKSEKEAQAYIEGIKKKHYNATHNVPVYVVGKDYEFQKFSDDGEPGGTAGLPILEMLKKEGITDVCIVVTRYFGGVKLGTGGLVRAYTQSAKTALQAGEIVQKRLYENLMVECDYTFHGKIQNEIMKHENIIIYDTVFTDKVIMKLYIRPDLLTTIKNKLTELTADQIKYIENPLSWLTFSNDELIKEDNNEI